MNLNLKDENAFKMDKDDNSTSSFITVGVMCLIIIQASGTYLLGSNLIWGKISNHHGQKLSNQLCSDCVDCYRRCVSKKPFKIFCI